VHLRDWLSLWWQLQRDFIVFLFLKYLLAVGSPKIQDNEKNKKTVCRQGSWRQGKDGKDFHINDNLTRSLIPV
jgi:hypothetical protein